jgi:tRNA pseudouridine-54 N-methylase
MDPAPSLLRHFVIPFTRLPCRHGAAGLDLVKTRGDVWCRCLTASLLVSRGTRNDTSFTALALAQPPASPNHALPTAAAAAASAAAAAAAAPPEPPLFLRACGRHVRALRPEQSTCAAILSAALPPPPLAGALSALRASGALNSMEGRRGCCMGLHAGLGGLGEALRALAAPALSGARPHALVLQEGAEPIGAALARLLGGGGGGGALPPTALLILLGDNEGLTAEHEAEAEGELRACGVPVARVSLGPTELLASQAICIAHYELDRAVGGSAVAKKAFDPEDKYADKVRPCHFCAPDHPDLQA